jgi:hypothetical protein
MLLGAHPNDTMDGNLRVTVAFNHFGANLTQRLPRSVSQQFVMLFCSLLRSWYILINLKIWLVQGACHWDAIKQQQIT